ncbi:MAG: hypothetical protein AABZ80_03595 [Gemmatimonadota bacterium]
MTFRKLVVYLAILGAGAWGASEYRTKREDSARTANEEGLPESAKAPASPGSMGSKFGPAAQVTADGMPAAPEGAEIRMLFIGNSLTYTWAMPQMLTGLARAGGINLKTEQHAPGGWRLVQHASAAEALTLIDAGGWTAVVLQEQSQWPAFSEQQVRSDVDPAATALAQRARASSPGVRILFYGTPANKNGDPRNAASIPELSAYEGMQTRLTATYRRLAREIGGVTVPAGEAWRAVRRANPEIELYGDDVHPSKAGAYLIACAFYGSMFARSPVGNSYTAGLEPSVAAQLQRAAWDAVIDEAARR